MSRQRNQRRLKRSLRISIALGVKCPENVAMVANLARMLSTPLRALLPHGVTGELIYSPEARHFQVQKGASLDDTHLADEINRYPTQEVQAAFLQTIQKREVTISPKWHVLSLVLKALN